MTSLERQSLQALGKFMCVSNEIFKDNLDLVLLFINSDFSDLVPVEIKKTMICAVGVLW